MGHIQSMHVVIDQALILSLAPFLTCLAYIFLVSSHFTMGRYKLDVLDCTLYIAIP